MAVVIGGTDYVQLPIGTSNQRPSTPAVGMIRVNSTTNALEVYSGTEWVIWRVF